MKIIAFTMAYNEAENIGRWVNYYQSQLGEDATLIVDNASDDSSAQFIRTHRNILYPKMVFSNNLRSSFISQMANALLLLHDVVIYTDADEMIVANPEKYANLREYFAKTSYPASTCLGFDVVHLLGEDSELNSGDRLLSKRRHIRPIRSMCKTLAIRRPIRWGGGFHTSDAPPHLDPDLWLFHTKSADLSQRLRRQAITRTVIRDDDSGAHQRWDDETVLTNFRRISQEPRKLFDRSAAQKMCDQLSQNFERLYLHHVDIVKYQINSNFSFEKGVYRLSDAFPAVF